MHVCEAVPLALEVIIFCLWHDVLLLGQGLALGMMDIIALVTDAYIADVNVHARCFNADLSLLCAVVVGNQAQGACALVTGHLLKVTGQAKQAPSTATYKRSSSGNSAACTRCIDLSYTALGYAAARCDSSTLLHDSLQSLVNYRKHECSCVDWPWLHACRVRIVQ